MIVKDFQDRKDIGMFTLASGVAALGSLNQLIGESETPIYPPRPTVARPHILSPWSEAKEADSCMRDSTYE
jgi:hypothetical protein